MGIWKNSQLLVFMSFREGLILGSVYQNALAFLLDWAWVRPARRRVTAKLY